MKLRKSIICYFAIALCSMLPFDGPVIMGYARCAFGGSVIIDGKVIDAHVVITTLSGAPTPTPPPIPTPTPPPSPGWLSLNNPIGSFYGFNAFACIGCGEDFHAVGGTAYKFIIDPLSVGVSDKPQIKVGDRSQAQPCNAISLSVLDANNNKTGDTIPMAAAGNASYIAQWPKGYIYKGQRLLLELVPSASMDMMIYW